MDAERGVANTGALIEVREGSGAVAARYLIDCGFTCGAQLRKLGLRGADIDAVFLSHPHGDHMDGLEIMGFRAHFHRGARVRLFAPPDVVERAWASLEPKMCTTDGGERAMRRFFDPCRTAGPIDLLDGRLRLEFVPVRHVPGFPAYGLALHVAPERDGPQIRWSGDTTFDPSSPLMRGVEPRRGDILFHECTFESRARDTVHTHAEELELLPVELRDRIVLVHHGRVEEGAHPVRHREMLLGQALQRYDLGPWAPGEIAKPLEPARARA
jgi:ribonuclease BN (tRNA processing enzyme)